MGFELLHAPTIGKTYVMSIGQTYVSSEHSNCVPKIHKTGFWDRLVEALRDAGVTEDFQTAAARSIRIKQPSVHEWSTGKSMPSMANVVKLAEKLHVSVEWLYTGRGDKHPRPQHDETVDKLWGLWPFLSAERGYARRYRHVERSKILALGSGRASRRLRWSSFFAFPLMT